MRPEQSSNPKETTSRLLMIISQATFSLNQPRRVMEENIIFELLTIKITDSS